LSGDTDIPSVRDAVYEINTVGRIEGRKEGNNKVRDPEAIIQTKKTGDVLR
jgi:hypothetical protein